MTGKRRTGLLAVFLSMLILSFIGFSLTYGRFSKESESSGGSYGSDIEYIVADQVKVKTEEEFIGAIENGYTNITISNEADDALVITADVTDVGVDLIINLNGHKLVRNNRNPLLNVKDGVRLTIIDSKQTGTFYNPVGSVFSISGGTLTVSGGNFESGPRKSEYNSESSVTETVNATVYQKSSDDTGYEEAQSGYSMPKLDGSQTGVYFENGVSGNLFVLADTYLYYTVENAGESIILKAEDGSADFYYSYEESGKQVVVYGYNNVKKSAENEETNYSIVSMISGNVYIRGGDYYSYFGLETTYGIYANGGYMEVEAGTFSVIEDGTCICSNYDVVSDEEYLRIADGSFTSEWGDTVQVNGGKLSLTGGSFVKDASKAPSGQTGSAVLRVTGGVIDGTGAHTEGLSFTLTGSQLYGIYAEKSQTNSVEVDLEVARFEFSGGTNNIGVYTEGGDVALGGITIANADLGIYVKSGSVKCSSTLNLDVNAGAIRIEGGSFTVQENATVAIKSGKSYTGQDTAWGYDSVYVSGGSLLSYGSLNITHAGAENDDQSTGSNGDTLYKEFQIKSYAVRVVAGENSSEVVIQKGEITNSCGGGIYIDVGQSDVVKLGSANMDDGEFAIETTGSTLQGNYISISGAAPNWAYKQSLNGGQAVRVNGGMLKIYGGTYSAAQGDGILVSNGIVDIVGGKFNGNDNYGGNGGGSVAGPAASYSFKMYGGTAIIYGGTFGDGSSGSGAFIMGSEDAMGNATILGGKFVVNGQAGFSIYEYANVVFGSDDNAGSSEITVTGSICGIAIEKCSAAVNIEINAGAFSSTSTSGNCDGIWYSNPNATLTIKGGTFTGSARSGLFFAAVPNGTNVQLSGGTFIGVSSSQHNTYYSNGAISTDGSERWVLGWNYTGNEIAVTDILDSGYEMRAGDASIADGYVHSDVAKYEEIEIVQRT